MPSDARLQEYVYLGGPEPRGLDYFLFEHRDLPDETPVIFGFAPAVLVEGKGYQPPRIPLGRLREEQLIRVAFQHEASTVVW